MMMFVTCPECGVTVSDKAVLMVCRHFPWTCPDCGAVNAPQDIPQGASQPVEEPEEVVTVEKGACPTPGGKTLFWNE